MKIFFSRLLAAANIFIFAIASFFPVQAYAAVHSPGTNVKAPDGTIYTIMPDGTKRSYTSGGAFISYGFNNWANVVTASQEDLNLLNGGFIAPQDGKIICSDRSSDKGTCYLITKGTKAGFTSQHVFEQLGFSFQRAVFGDVSFLAATSNIDSDFEAHRPGVLINKDGTIYLVAENGLLGFPNMEIFYSWGYQLQEVVTANAKDRNMQQIGVVAYRAAGQLMPASGNSNISTWPPVLSSSNFTALLSSFSPKNNIAAGTNNQVLFEFQLVAPLDKAVEVRQVSLDFGGNIPPSYFSNIKLHHYETNAQIGSNSGNVLTHTSAGYVISPPLVLNKGSSAYIQVKADINNQAAGYSYVGKLTEVWTTSAAGDVNLASIVGLPVIGHQINFVKDTVATVFLDTSRPSSSLLNQGQKGVTIFNFGITNGGESTIAYKSVGVKLKGTSPLSAFTNLYLYNSSGALLGSEPLKSEKNYGDVIYYDVNFSPVAIGTNSTAYFTVKADVGFQAIGVYNFQIDLLGVAEGYIAASTTKGLLEWTTPNITISPSASNSSGNISILAPLGGAITLGDPYKIKWYDSSFCIQSSGSNVACPTSLLYSVYILTDATKSMFKPGVDPGTYAYYIGTINSNNALGEYTWFAGDVYTQGIRSSLQPNTNYYVLVTKTGTSEYGLNPNPFQFPTPLSNAAKERDQKRLADIRQLASALELYFNDYMQYPYSLNALAPTYIGIVPSAPLEADGICTASQNSYFYSSPIASSYTLTFCLGAVTGGYSAGPRVLSPAGIQ